MIQSATVLGAGTMGAQIAAHLANAGLPVLLLDVTVETAVEGLKRARSLKPDPFVTADAASRIQPGPLDAQLERGCQTDWVVEAVIERLDVKRALYERIDAYGGSAIVSSNTSGIPISALAEGRSTAFRRRFLGTHFFNPPRYLHLVELIPTRDTGSAELDRMREFLDRRLGKGVVIARDTPNFIANHIGLYGVLRVFDALATGDYTIEEIDAITGPPIGRPKSATFRTLDLTGLDILVHVTRNLTGRLAQADAPLFQVPALVDELVARGALGEKAGRGFYRKETRAEGSEILTLDPATLDYRPKQPVRLPSLEQVRNVDDPALRVRALFNGRDKVGAFLRATLAPTLLYTARVAPEIADSIDAVDRAMRWGYGWDLGPFELADAIGLPELVETAPSLPVPPLIAERLARGERTFRGGRGLPPPEGTLTLRAPGVVVVKRNPGASLVELGDGVLAVDLHSKMNALGGDTMTMLQRAVAEAEQRAAALVVTTDSANFSVGANLMLLLLEAQEGNWDDVDLMVRTFQRTTMALRLARIPVVVAPVGLTLGGGCEILLHADRVQAAVESYIGLVEAGVGLIPAGGGCKELIARAYAELAPGPQVDRLPPIQRAFETVGFAKTSTSAVDARRLGLLRDVDGISMNRDRLVNDAKVAALGLAAAGYQPPVLRAAIAVGGAPVKAALDLGVHLAHRAGRISDHDARVGRALAHVLSGGSAPHATTLSEQALLDLEREAFLGLCGERKTLERIAHTLKTGKPLRN